MQADAARCAQADDVRMPAARELGIAVIRADADQVECAMTITDRHLNQGGLAHGGVLFTLADTALGLLANPADQDTTWVGTSFSLQLYRAAHVGDLITATAVAEHRSRNLAAYRVELSRSADRAVTGVSADRAVIGVMAAQLQPVRS